MDKIYSRNKLKFRYDSKFKKKTKVLATLIIILVTMYISMDSILPVFDKLCQDEAKTIATRITNEKSSEVIIKFNYDDLFTIQKDQDGNIKMITADTYNINLLTSDIATEIEKGLNESGTKNVRMNLGTLMGNRFLSGVGPNVKIDVETVGNVMTDLKSEFKAEGINQTLHRVYLEVQSTVNILTPYKVMQETITNQVLLLENVIVGEIPETYYNIMLNDAEQALKFAN